METAPSDPDWLDSWRGILFANAKVLHATEAALQSHSGVSLAALDALGRLYDAPDRQLRMQELQERSLFTPSGMTRLVDRLARDGFVTREPVPGDRRGVMIVLTAEGAQKHEVALAKHLADIEREYAGRLSPAQHKAVARALDQFWHD